MSDVNTDKLQKYVASYPNCYQIGPNTFEEWIETKICDRNTTLGEIHDWMKSRSNAAVELRVTISQATS